MSERNLLDYYRKGKTESFRISTMGPHANDYLEVKKHALVTDSFHGACFSILERVPFLYLPNSSVTKSYRNRRVLDLLDDLGLVSQVTNAERLADDIANLSYENPFTDKFEGKLLDKRIKSDNWIKRQIGEGPQ